MELIASIQTAFIHFPELTYLTEPHLCLKYLKPTDRVSVGNVCLCKPLIWRKFYLYD